MKLGNSITVASLLWIGISSLLSSTTLALSTVPTTTGNNQQQQQQQQQQQVSRRSALLSLGSVGAAATVLWGGGGGTIISPANAATDCMKDCLKNCKQVAPKDPEYCLENCRGYCDQDDRNDGLSGSVSSDGGEMGILGISTVVKGEDKPPSISIPGLDFNSEKGRKLLGY
mmetsp:Transcript_3186/g.3823  ORF Transcript_3186/g.3823 Transcript_3186/m.3823 type:complete len:171 (+) Transcript_3186:88-600(+)